LQPLYDVEDEPLNWLEITVTTELGKWKTESCIMQQFSYRLQTRINGICTTYV